MLLTIGDKCRTLFDKRVRGIRPKFVQADELWTFVHTKERHLRPGSPNEWGDSYIWMAIDSDTKMVLSYLVAKREGTSAYDFIRDLSERVTGRFQLTTIRPLARRVRRILQGISLRRWMPMETGRATTMMPCIG